MLLTIIGAMRLASIVQARPRATLAPAGAIIAVVGMSLHSQAVLVAGFLILLVGLILPFDPDAAPPWPPR